MTKNAKFLNGASRAVTRSITAAVVATATAVSLVVLSGPAQAAQASPSGTGTTQRWSGAVNTTNLAAVNSAYWAQYAPKFSLPISWLGGSVNSCLPGVSGAASNAATLSAVNFVRSLAGLAPVTFSPDLNARAQATALMMDANDRLDHFPSSSWKCWSAVGAATASKSNLAMAWPDLKSGQVVGLYMDDKGPSNEAVGHRRWILNPFTTTMGNGSTSTANAMVVVGPTNRARPNPRFVGWPTAGYFPNAMEPAGRWSLSAGQGKVNFKRARVAVYRNGVRVPVTKLPVHNGYAQPTLVFQLNPAVAKSGNFRVVVTKIKRGAAKPFKYVYNVRMFTPHQ